MASKIDQTTFDQALVDLQTGIQGLIDSNKESVLSQAKLSGTSTVKLVFSATICLSGKVHDTELKFVSEPKNAKVSDKRHSQGEDPDQTSIDFGAISVPGIPPVDNFDFPAIAGSEVIAKGKRGRKPKAKSEEQPADDENPED